MSEANVERARRHYDAWNRGATEEVISGLAPDVHWHGHPSLPEPGPYDDRDAVERWMGQFREAWGELSAEPVELLDAGDSVVALVHMTGTGRGSGVEVRGGVDVHVATVGGEELRYFRIYQGFEAAERVGLEDAEREILTLRVQEGMADAEIAARLGVDEGKLSAMFEAAFEKLRGLPASEQVR